MTANPKGQPFDIDQAIADVRHHARTRTDAMSLESLRLGEEFARQLAVTIPDREEWPSVARATIASVSQILSLFDDNAILFLGPRAMNYSRVVINSAAVGAVELLDRYEAETDEATRKPERHWLTRADEIAETVTAGTTPRELATKIAALVADEAFRAYSEGAEAGRAALLEDIAAAPAEEDQEGTR